MAAVRYRCTLASVGGRMLCALVLEGALTCSVTMVGTTQCFDHCACCHYPGSLAKPALSALLSLVQVIVVSSLRAEEGGMQ